MQFSIVAVAAIMAATETVYAAGAIGAAARGAATAARVGSEAANVAGAATSGQNNNKREAETPQQFETALNNCIHEYTQTPTFSMHSDGADSVTLVNVGPQCMALGNAWVANPASAQLDPVFGKLSVLNTNTLQLTQIPQQYQQEVKDAIAEDKTAAAKAGNH